MSSCVKKAIFPVGGLGTRFLPATKSMPKEMLPVVDKPLIQFAVEEALAAGIEELIFVTGRGKTAIEDHFDRSFELEATLKSRAKHDDLDQLAQMQLLPGRIVYVRQQEPLGLGHAVWCARHLVKDEPFAVILADDLILSKRSCLAQMVDAYDKTGGNLVAAMDVPLAHTSRYGILTPQSTDGSLVMASGVVEKPHSDVAPSQTAVIGRYILDPAIFGYLDSQIKGAGGEIQLTDAIARMLPDFPLSGLRFEGTRYDCGSKEGMIAATIAYAMQRPDLSQETRAIVQSYCL